MPVACPKSVVILDDHPPSAEGTGRAFAAQGWTVAIAPDLDSARASWALRPPELIVSELRIKGRPVFDCGDELKRASLGCRLWILTDYPSVATAVRSVRLGFDAYLTKPIQPGQIAATLEGRPPADGARAGEAREWASLDRAIWEFINQVYAVSGSLSETARRLGVDRRSLRRMLAKYPPPE